MARVLPLAAFLVACSDAGVTKFNTDPTAELTSHASGAVEGPGVSAIEMNDIFFTNLSRLV